MDSFSRPASFAACVESHAGPTSTGDGVGVFVGAFTTSFGIVPVFNAAISTVFGWFNASTNPSSIAPLPIEESTCFDGVGEASTDFPALLFRLTMSIISVWISVKRHI